MDPFTIKPLDWEAVRGHAAVCGGRVVTVEDHYPEVGRIQFKYWTHKKRKEFQKYSCYNSNYLTRSRKIKWKQLKFRSLKILLLKPYLFKKSRRSTSV